MHDKMERVKASSYTKSRSVLERLTLKKGRYLLIPSTFDPGFNGEYMLRVYCGKDADCRCVKYIGKCRVSF